MNVSAVLVTRGNVPLDGIVASLPFDDVVVWDNSVEQIDVSVYGRYAAVARARHQVIYVQDDDVVLPAASIAALLDAYRPGTVTANMSAYHRRHTLDSALVGFGAIFDRELPLRAFRRYRDAVPPTNRGEGMLDELFLRVCDVVFTALTPRHAITVPYRYLPCAYDDDRMSRQPGFAVEREQVLDLCRSIVRSAG